MLLYQLLAKHKPPVIVSIVLFISHFLTPALLKSSKTEMFLGLLFKALKSHINSKRVAAFSKRLLQCLSLGYYDPWMCEPAYCNGDRVCWRELTALASHVHPSIATMARNLLLGATIMYSVTDGMELQSILVVIRSLQWLLI